MQTPDLAQWRTSMTDLMQSGVKSLLQRPGRLDHLVHLLLRVMAAQYSLRPTLRQFLRSSDGWIDFSVGVATRDSSVEQSIAFQGGRATAHRGLLADADVVLTFNDDDALLTMLKATPNESLTLILRNQLVLTGNWCYLQLFNYLVAQLLGSYHQRKLRANAKADQRSRRTDFGGCDPEVRQELAARAAQRLTAEATEPGVTCLRDPYLAKYSLGDFPRLRTFLDLHLSQKAEICAERAQILTTWFRTHGFEARADGRPWHPVERQGLAFKHLMTRKQPVIRRDDLFAGSTTTNPTTGSVVFPDGQGTMVWGELDSIDQRQLIPFAISRETARTLHSDVFPYWTTRNFREWVRRKYGSTLSQQLGERWVTYFVWKSVGISHTVPDFSAVLRDGLCGVIAGVQERLSGVAEDAESAVTYRAMIACLEGVHSYAAALAQLATEQARAETDPARKAELNEIARICATVPNQPARSLHEALMAIWIVWVALHNENADTGLSLGRLDQLLQPYFVAEMAQLNSDAARDSYIARAIELVGCFFMRCTDHFPLSPDIGNTLFGGASSTQALTLGGVTPEGADAVNDMTYIFLKVTELLGIRDVNVNARYKPGVSSPTYLRRLCEVNLLTAGTPSMHNDDAVFAALQPHGYPLEQIRDWSATGCVEPTISGQHMGHTGAILMNLVAGLEMALNDGVHPLIGEQIGPRTGDLAAGDFTSFEAFFEAYAEQQRFLIAQAVELNNQLAEMHALHRPTPLLSALIGGSIESGTDVTRGGARFNSSGTSNIGLADVTDSLLALKQLVFDEQRVEIARFKAGIDSNFANDPALNALTQHQVSRFGSGDPAAREMANRVAKMVHDAYAAHCNYRGGSYRTGFWSMSQHVAYGNLSGALPSGRRAWKAFTPGLTPDPGASKSFLDNIQDVAQLAPENMDNNIAFNVKLLPNARDSREKTVGTMQAYVETYFQSGGMQIQFNVVSAETLRDAMAHPENYRGLLVRISGYNAYFVTLNREIQLELIERAEYAL